MTETKVPTEKKVLLEIDNVRIKEYDRLNVQIEAYETYYNPIEKKDTQGWKFKGYSATVLSALLQIQRKEYLIDENAIQDLKTYVEAVKASNLKLRKAIEDAIL